MWVYCMNWLFKRVLKQTYVTWGCRTVCSARNRRRSTDLSDGFAWRSTRHGPSTSPSLWGGFLLLMKQTQKEKKSIKKNSRFPKNSPLPSYPVCNHPSSACGELKDATEEWNSISWHVTREMSTSYILRKTRKMKIAE